MRQLRAPVVALVLVSAAVAAAAQVVPERVDAIEQVRRVVHGFATSNEFHRVDTGRFTDDPSTLSRGFEVPYADSVRLQVFVSPDGLGQQVVGTHVRLGLAHGCAVFTPDVEPISTPGGVRPDAMKVTCDPVPTGGGER